MELREIVAREFERFGYHRHDTIGNQYTFAMVGVKPINGNRRQTITFNKKTNMVILEQYVGEDAHGKVEPFGVMAPLGEVIDLGRTAYGICSRTRSYNIDGTQNNIIEGTNGDKKFCSECEYEVSECTCTEDMLFHESEGRGK